MSEKERIHHAVDEMFSAMGGALLVRTVAALVADHMECLADMQSLLDQIVSKAMNLSTHPSAWDEDNHDEVSSHLIGVIARMKQAYGESFRLDGAITYLRQVASSAELLRKQLEKGD